MPVWLTVFVAVLVALAVAETVIAARRRRPVIVLTDRDVRRHLKAWPLRLVAGLAKILALLQRTVYRAGRPDWAVDAFTTACLLGAVLLVYASWRLAKTGR